MKLNLILAHGYMGFRNIGPFEYFNGVKKYLEDRYPVTVVETKVDPLKGVELRAEQLRRQTLIAAGEIPPETAEEHAIAARLAPQQPIHLIAHSMGSLDCRVLLSPANENNLGGRVTTLTTVGGPHRGSPTADLLYREIEGQSLSAFERRVAKHLRNLFRLLGISLQGLADLTTESTAKLNATYHNHPDVSYFSSAGCGRDGKEPTAQVMVWSWRYVHEKTGEANDGVVPISSARWGELDPDFWPADHPELIGHDVNRCGEAPKDFDYLARYGQLVERLLP